MAKIILDHCPYAGGPGPQNRKCAWKKIKKNLFTRNRAMFMILMRRPSRRACMKKPGREPIRKKRLFTR